MQIITEVEQWRTLRRSFNADQSIGLVATMGCLHVGHASLLKEARKNNQITVLTIFVNPTQFNDIKDYQNYPSTLEQDLALAKQLAVDYVLVPDEQSLYPGNQQTTLVTTHPLATILEGAYRSEHFNGVLTVVMKLLMLVRPTHAYFGEKDYQQYRLIESLVADYFIETKIILCPTIREDSGLALSSRNRRLSVEQMNLAEQYATYFKQCDPNNLASTREVLQAIGITVEYLEKYQDRLYISVIIGENRLIDNRKIEATHVN